MKTQHIVVLFGVLIGLAAGIPLSTAKAATCAPPGTATYDDNNLMYVEYFGSWNLLTGSPYQHAMWQTLHGTTDPNAYVRFCFTGSRITKFFSMAYNRGTEYVYIDGVLRSTYSSYAPEVRRQIGQTWELPYGQHTIEIRSDANTSTSTDIDGFAVDIPTFGYNTYDNTDSAIRYIGSSWVNGSLTGAGRSTISSSHIVGELARLTFRGEKLVFVYTKRPDRSIGVVTIDGIDKGSINFYNSTDQKQYSTVYDNLGPGIHIVNITNNAGGQYIDVDYFTVMVQGRAQIFPRYQISAGFIGVSAYVTTPNPPLYKGKVATPVAVSNYTHPLRFIEAGAVKDCDPPLTVCELHPYMSFTDSSGATRYEREDSVFLGAGITYQYKVFLTSSNLWEAQFCDVSGCRVLYQDVNIGTTSALPYVISGGEDSRSAAIGPQTTSNNKYMPLASSAWLPWCPSSVINNVGGYYSGCGANNTWSMNNP